MKTLTLANSLAETEPFRGLAPHHLAFIEGCASNVHFDKDAFLLFEGQDADTFFVIRHGSVALEMHGGARIVTVQTVDEGGLLGWSWLVPPYIFHFDARALTPVSAIAFDAVCVRRKCEADPVFGYEIYKRISKVIVERLMASSMQLLDMYK